MSKAESKPRRWNYSLRTILLLIAVLCVALGSYVTSRRLREAEQELRKRRAETGYLSVEDSSQFHAIALKSDEENTWRWRLFIPKSYRYSWNIACENIPQNTIPQKPAISGMSNEPYWNNDNEVLVTAKLRRVDNETWQLSIDSKIGESKHQMYGATLAIPHEKLRWMSEVSSTDGRVIGSGRMDVRDPKGPIILLQRRPCERQPDGSYSPSPNPMPGFMIWLTRI